jgi:hypothetical protein
MRIFDIVEELEKERKKNKELNNILNECANEILKEIQENHHLSAGVALSIRQKLLNYQEIEGNDKE